ETEDAHGLLALAAKVLDLMADEGDLAVQRQALAQMFLVQKVGQPGKLRRGPGGLDQAILEANRFHKLAAAIHPDPYGAIDLHAAGQRCEDTGQQGHRPMTQRGRRPHHRTPHSFRSVHSAVSSTRTRASVIQESQIVRTCSWLMVSGSVEMDAASFVRAS